MTEEDTKVAVLLRCSIDALSSSNTNDAVGFFSRQPSLSAVKAGSTWAHELNRERHVWKKCGRVGLSPVASVYLKLITWGIKYSGPSGVFRSLMPGGKMFSPQLTVLVLGRLAVVAELGDLLFQASTIWTTQMSTVMGRGNSNLIFSPQWRKRLLTCITRRSHN
jgi:hypothetical protein